MLHSKIPGYTRAAARAARLEEAWREFPFLGVTDSICGVVVNPLTLRMFIQLCAARSPFLVGGTVGPEHVAQFLWRLSPQYGAHDRIRQEFVASIAHLDFRKTVRAINRFLDRQFLDRPPSSGSATSESDVSFAAAIIHTIAAAYSWGKDQILDYPMPAIFQAVRQIQRDRMAKYGKDMPRFNPLRARFTKKIVDRARAERKRQKAEKKECSSASK